MDFIDIHMHILPGLDDGSQDLEDTLAMAKIAYMDGVRKLVATPHVMKGVFNNGKEEILTHTANINYYLKIFGIKLQVLPGAEYYLEPDLAERMAAGDLLTLNDGGQYLLVELPSAMIPEYTDRVLYQLQMQGVSPIIAHPERNPVLRKKPSKLEEWANRGILAQVTSTSITGGFGREVQKTALKFIENHTAQLIASDSHDTYQRIPNMHRAFQEVERRFNLDLAVKLTVQNPLRIISGQKLPMDAIKTTENSWSKYLTRIYSFNGN